MSAAEPLLDHDDGHIGDVIEDHAGVWRWVCSTCPGRSISTYPTFDDAYEALKRHHDAAGRLHR